MSLSSVSISRPVLSIVMSLAIVIFGIIGFRYLGVREFPVADPPVITVSTNYTGANAEIIETQITEPLEESINGIDGIRSLTSTSAEGKSNITVEFTIGKDIENAANDVRERVSRAQRNLPRDADPPIITKADASSDYVIFVNITSSKRDLLELSRIAETVFKERLQTIEGVSDIQIYGEKRYSMRLWFDPAKMSAYGVTLNDIQNALNNENVELPAGRIEGLYTELGMRTLGRMNEVEEYNNLIIKEDQTRTIRLRDIGYSIIGPESDRGYMKRDGNPMIGVPVFARPGANNVAIVDEFYKRFEQIKKELPADVEAVVAIDNTKYVRASILEVEETAFIAFGLVIIIIFLFLRDWRSTLIPVIAIPISLVGAFFIMYVAGFSINILTMLGIVLSIGLVVDDAIVVLENIYAKIEEGMTPMRAAEEGSKEIFFAVLSTTVVLAAVFLPVIFLEGLTGRLFREFGVVVAGSVIISAFVALTLTPMMCGKILRKSEHNWFYRKTEPFFVAFTGAYKSGLLVFLHHRWIAIAVLILSFVLIFFVGRNVPSELAPLEDRSQLRINTTAPEATTVEQMTNYMDELNQMVDDSIGDEKQSVLWILGSSRSGSGVNSGSLRIILKKPDERKFTQQELAAKLNRICKNYNATKTLVLQEQTIGDKRAGLPVQFVIQAPELARLKEIMPLFIENVSKDPTFTVNDVNLKFTKPELEIEIDREKARNLGVSVNDIAQTLQLAYSGNRMGYFIKNGKQYQIIGQMEKVYRDTPKDILSLYVGNNKGQLIQLGNIVNLKEQATAPQLYRYNRFASVTISAGLAPGKAMGDGIAAMNKIAGETLDDSFFTALTGPAKDFAESSSSILFSFTLALVLIYMILAAQFESFKDPVIILFTVPMALAGALISLWYFDQTLNLFSQIGIIMLIGLVTKNGILIIEFANQKREEGLTVFEAVSEASTARFRPILMTNLATILGFVPIALALGAGAESRVSMGIAVVGGLIFSGLLTLYVIPAMYLIFNSKSKKKLPEPIFIAGIVIVIFFFVNTSIQAQQVLTLQEAIEAALKSNYDVEIAKNNLKMAQNNATTGNAGMQPSVSLSAVSTNSINNTKQTFFTGAVQERSNANSNQISGGPVLNWTIFDGMNMFNKYAINKGQAELQDISLKIAVQNTVYNVQMQYFNIVKQEQVMSALSENIKLLEFRRNLAETKNEVGTGAKNEVLQAKIDLNSNKSNYLRQELILEQSKNALRQLMGGSNHTEDFDVADTVVYLSDIQIELIKTDFEIKNTSILSVRKNKDLAYLNTKSARSALFPVLNINLGYNFLYLKSQAGNTSANQSYGLNYGAIFSWPLWSGGSVQRQIQNAKIANISAETVYSQIRSQESLALNQNLKSYDNMLKIVTIEDESSKLAKENLEIGFEKYKLGRISGYELQLIQQSYIDSRTNLINSYYDAKMSELDLLKSCGKLVD